METKDLFSSHSDLYAAFRPTYPEDLYQFIFQFVANKDAAWDCATGNGQVARRLSQDFRTVQATDISKKQLEKAFPSPNIFYSVAPAEKTPFSESTFDLITAAQAMHWFDPGAFYKEAQRVAKPPCILAVWGYGNISINKYLDEQVQYLYSDVVGKYWDAARRHVETEYSELPFPFETIETPRFYISTEWTFNHLTGYLESWSATQKYIKEHKRNPVAEFAEKLKAAWGSEEKHLIKFPIFMKLTRI